MLTGFFVPIAADAQPLRECVAQLWSAMMVVSCCVSHQLMERIVASKAGAYIMILQGDIISDLCAGLIGGLGLTPSANVGAHMPSRSLPS